MRKIGVVTGSRADYGIYRPVLREITKRPGLELSVYVTGSHLVEKYGLTVNSIENDGFPISARISCWPGADTPQAFTKAMGGAICAFAEVFAGARPDILLALGDRYEMHAAVCAASQFLLPVAHIHGGEITEGAIDENYRHSITKLSHLHFAATTAYAERIIRMGEEPWRVTVSGAPGLDNLNDIEFVPRDELAADLGIPLTPAPLLAAFHPATVEQEHAREQADAFFGALSEIEVPVLITAPNGDIGSDYILDAIKKHVARCPGSRFVESLGTRRYFSMLKYAAAMAGNSSSGIIEAASFGLPVVNVGTRQRGRVRGRNVIDVGSGKRDILEGLRKALSTEFSGSLEGMENPYGDGNAAGRIVDVLAAVQLDRKLVCKKFHD